MDKVVDYKIVYGNEANQLSEKVSQSIKEGWQPVGYPHFHHYGNVLCSIYQMMVKYTNQETK